MWYLVVTYQSHGGCTSSTSLQGEAKRTKIVGRLRWGAASWSGFQDVSGRIHWNLLIVVVKNNNGF
jgi:hypothetical protein